MEFDGPTIVFTDVTQDADELETRCGRFGQVTGVSRTVQGFVAVTFRSHKSAQAAIDKFQSSLSVVWASAVVVGGVDVVVDDVQMTTEPVAPAAPQYPTTIKWEVPEEPVSAWRPDLGFDELMADYLAMNRKDFHNRYLLIALDSLPAEAGVGQDAGKLREWLNAFPGADELMNIDVFSFPSVAAGGANVVVNEVGNVVVNGVSIAHCTFKSTKAVGGLLHSLPETVVACFGPPLVPTEKLWFACAAFPVVDREEFRRLIEKFGRIEDYGFYPERGCAFANFPIIEDAIKCRNTLYACDCASGWSMNVDFVPPNVARGGRVELLPKVDVMDRNYDRVDRADRRGRADGRDRSRSRERYGREKVRLSRRDRSRSRSRDRGGDRDRERERERMVIEPVRSREVGVEFELSKLGDVAGRVRGRVVEGDEQMAVRFFEANDKVNVDQRSKVDHCKSNLEEKHVVIEIHSTAEAELGPFCSYFIEKERLGFFSVGNYLLYLIPTVRQFLDALDLKKHKSTRAPLLAVLVEKQ